MASRVTLIERHRPPCCLDRTFQIKKRSPRASQIAPQASLSGRQGDRFLQKFSSPESAGILLLLSNNFLQSHLST
tara:strand:- start:173 stop:397 length:225 start_codon:yes stop_codon:yes gene_type:complete